MFGRIHNTYTTRTQDVDNIDIDEVIEDRIKACQMENGRCMTSTSNKLREKYGDEQVTRILRRLRTRRYRGNKYQEKGTNEIMKLFKQLMTKKVNKEQLSL